MIFHQSEAWLLKEKCMKFISQSQIKVDYTTLVNSELFTDIKYFKIIITIYYLRNLPYFSNFCSIASL